MCPKRAKHWGSGVNKQRQPIQGMPLFNPMSPDFIANPYPFYCRLRTVQGWRAA